ncbi:MAG: HD domain-containing protein [Endomicrobium sp.]|jgi:metal-dependent HD superfamily phosphatase/phosphodiesterase|nr:HD domain-containing protein [Endomicrobium sp.]
MDDMLTFEEIKNNAEIQMYFRYMGKYFESTNEAFNLIKRKSYDENHALQAAEVAERVLKYLGYKKREQELSKIAAYIHDIGNIISKNGHDQSSAIMFLNIIGDDRYDEDVFTIASAVGCHEDKTAEPATPIAAAVVIGDKTDVSHERIGREDLYDLDKHSLVVAACQKVNVIVNKEKMSIELKIKIDSTICSVMNYFEIFMSRINYCRRASNVLKCNFELYINDDKFL